MKSLPLFHQIAGKPVIVLGEGAMAEPKRRLVERAGGQVVGELQEGLARGARLAFVAHPDAALCEADAIRLRGAGLLVNVVDRPDLCDFTTPSVLDRDPLLVALGTGGASAGLAKHVRLRLERLLPATLGRLAQALDALKPDLRRRFPDPAERRRAIDSALGEGGPLDVLDPASVQRAGLEAFGADPSQEASVHEFALASADPDDLTLRQARLLGLADAVIADPAISPAILDRARADALRLALPHAGKLPAGLVVILKCEGSE